MILMNLSGGRTAEDSYQSLNWDVMETPDKAFYRKSMPLIRGNCDP